jgi:lipopolysaccharide heptosyltransferase I
MRFLIVRLSSMGDVVHTLPALSDAAHANPSIRFDWAVDEAFAQIPAWHRNVDNVFPIALRRWRGDLVSPGGRAEARDFLKAFRAEKYDLIVDLQGEFKSAFVARLAKGARAGYDGASAREWGAHLSYRQKYAVPKGSHSMVRMRRLLSQALSYSYDENSVDYGIERARLLPAPLKIAQPYVVLIHSTSWASKNWPEHYWRELTEKLAAAGFSIVLPWGSEAERERSLRIAENNARVIVLPQLSISEKASIIGGAAGTVGLDTGLSHIAAALGVPSVTLYGATDPNLCGTIGENQIQIVSGFECVKCHETECTFANATFKPACFEEIRPADVWKQLQGLLAPAPNGSKNVYQLA